MKFSKIYSTGILVTAVALLFASCNKGDGHAFSHLENRDLNNKARIQVFNAAIGSQRTFVYSDAARLNGTALAYTASAFTGSPLTFVVNPGLHSFMIKDDLATSTQPTLTFPQDFQANKTYTMFIYDTLNAIKQKTVLTEIVKPNDGSARLRFANFPVRKPGTPPNVDVFSKRLNANIFSDVPYTGVTDFVNVPGLESDSIFVRAAGTTTNLIAGSFSFLTNESYTIIFRGRYDGGTAYPRTLTSFINY